MSKGDRSVLGSLLLAMLAGIGGSLALAASCLARDHAHRTDESAIGTTEITSVELPGGTPPAPATAARPPASPPPTPAPAAEPPPPAPPETTADAGVVEPPPEVLDAAATAKLSTERNVPDVPGP